MPPIIANSFPSSSFLSVSCSALFCCHTLSLRLLFDLHLSHYRSISQKISEHSILSAPVWDEKEGKYIGFLDTRDLVQFVVFQSDERKRQAMAASDNLAPPDVDMKAIVDAAAKMFSRPLDGITVPYLARRNKFYPVYEDDTLLKVVEILANHGAHRVPVVSRETKKVIDIISQSTIIKFLASKEADFKEAFGKTVDGTQIGSRPVIPIKSDATALETFKVMAKYNRSGVAVVDAETGRFVGNTSGSDLKLFIREPEKNAAALQAPITDFLSAIRRAESPSSNTRCPTISVSASDTIGMIVGKLAATRIHRIFVADDATGYKPTAIVAISDVLRWTLGYGLTPVVTIAAQ
jgi:CBS domain-containing protein